MIEFAPRSKAEMTYDEALLYCQFLEYNGHTDWRMPLFSEYYELKTIHGWVWYIGKLKLARLTSTPKLHVIPVRSI